MFMSSSAEGKVRCEHCQRAYAWQEKYAGKKVRCKCGEAIRFPATNPAQQELELELNLDSGYDLNLGASKASAKPAGNALDTPDGQLNVPPPANFGGPVCPSCKANVRPGAVICVSCGFNLKEGSKINTAVGVQMAGGGQVYDEYADRIFGRFKRSWTFAKISYGMIWDFKQLLLFPVFSCIAALLVMISFAIPILILIFADANNTMQAMAEQQQQMQAQQQAQVQPADTTPGAATDGQNVASDATPPALTVTNPATGEKIPARELTDEEKEDFAQLRKDLIAEGRTEAEADKIVEQSKVMMFQVENAFGRLEDGGASSFESEPMDTGMLILWGAVGFAFYFCNYFVIAFFNTGLVACAMKVMNGEVPTVKYGLEVAFKRLPQIIAWACVSAVVGMIIKRIENTSELVGAIIAFVLGAAWTTLTYFVVPVIAVEGIGPFKSIKTSVKTIKTAWGTSLCGNFSLSLMTLAMMIPLVVLFFATMILAGGVLQSPVMMACFFMLFLVAFGLLVIASSAAEVVLSAILYSFASGKILPAGYDTDALSAAFARPRRRWWSRLLIRDLDS
jgi:hypothetical protein